jgi:hypothetical protein
VLDAVTARVNQRSIQNLSLHTHTPNPHLPLSLSLPRKSNEALSLSTTGYATGALGFYTVFESKPARIQQIPVGKMRHRSDPSSTTSLVKYVLVGLIALLGLACLYYGSYFAPGSRRSDDEDGSDQVFGSFVLNHDPEDLLEDQEHNPEVPKSIPVSNAFVLILIFSFQCVKIIAFIKNVVFV